MPKSHELAQMFSISYEGQMTEAVYILYKPLAQGN